jgi:hypothetical protein
VNYRILQKKQKSMCMHRSPKGRHPKKKYSAAEGENLPAKIKN